jgi:hypothetical protein
MKEPQMNARTRWLLLLLLAVVLLAGVTAAAAAPAKPAPHPPICTIVNTLPKDVILGVSCYDRGGDINEAVVVESNVPVRWDADFDGYTAFLQVYRPGFEEDITIILTWCVADQQGNMVIQKFSWHD